MRRRLLLVLLVLCTNSFARQLNWLQAVVVLDDKQVLVGEVVINPSLNVVLYRSGETRAFYPASKISYIHIHDGKVNVPRKFIASSSCQHGRTVTHLYEIVLQGELSVIRRPHGGTLPEFNDIYNYDYFVMDDNSVIGLADFKKKIYPLIKQYYSETELMTMLDDKTFPSGSKSEAIRLIDIYNRRLISPGSKAM